MGINIKQPVARKKVLLGQTIDFVGTVALGTHRVELTTEDGFVLPTVTLKRQSWSVSNRFNEPGIRRVVARAFDSAGLEIGTAVVDVDIVTSPADFGELIPIPAGINQGLSAARQKTMLDIFGRPCPLNADCTAVTNDKVRNLLVTRNVGPFSVTGIQPTVEALSRIFAQVKRDHPDLYRVLGTAGVLCCRRVRRRPGLPPSPNFSNHSWGTAIDLKIRGALDPRGDGKTQLGVALLAPYFHAEGFYWGAGFKGESEDAMHFEVSDKLVRDWHRKGLLG